MLAALSALTDVVPDLSIEPPVSFHQNVDRRHSVAECWPWTGPRVPQGYGMTRVRCCGGHHTAHAHRIAYWLDTGFWHWGRFGPVVRHLCHNPSCCNPLHLLHGSRADNAWDNQMREAGFDLVAMRIALDVTAGRRAPQRGSA